MVCETGSLTSTLQDAIYYYYYLLYPLSTLTIIGVHNVTLMKYPVRMRYFEKSLSILFEYCVFGQQPFYYACFIEYSFSVTFDIICRYCLRRVKRPVSLLRHKYMQDLDNCIMNKCISTNVCQTST